MGTVIGPSSSRRPRGYRRVASGLVGAALVSAGLATGAATVSPFGGLTANTLMLNVLDRAYKLSPLDPGAVAPQPVDPGFDSP